MSTTDDTIPTGSPPNVSTPTGNTYDKYGSTNPIERRMMRTFFAALDRYLDETAPTRIFEIGIGEGIVTKRVIERFEGVPVIGLDLPDEELAAQWQSRDLSCTFGDASSLPFPDGAFDLVLAIEVFEHLADPAAAIIELARVCSGSLIASVPLEPVWRIGNMARGRYLRELGNTPGHINHWTHRGFEKLVASQFEVVDRATPLPWTMVLATARRRGVARSV
jgi:SAM-dependent methyltransferase